jgi:transposase InsO family protein
MHIYADMTEKSSVDFLRRLKLASPIRISKILTDNGSQFTDRFAMVERFNGRINELLQQTRFDSKADLEAALMNYLKLYNHHIPQRSLDAKTPILALKEWQKKRP